MEDICLCRVESLPCDSAGMAVRAKINPTKLTDQVLRRNTTWQTQLERTCQCATLATGKYTRQTDERDVKNQICQSWNIEINREN